MRGPVLAALAALTAACGGGHGGGTPGAVPIPAIDGDALFVVNGGDATLTAIDPATSSILGTIALTDAMFPHHLYASADRREMYLAIPGVDLSGGHGGGGHGGGHQGGGHVLRLDARTGATLAVAALPTMNHNAAPAPDGTVWTTQMDDAGQVLVLDGSTLETIETIDVGALPAEVTFAPDGSVALVANGGSDTVSAIDAVTRQVSATIPVGDNPVGAWPASDGRAYVDNETGASISAIDPATLTVEATFPLGFTPAFAAIVAGELWVTDVDGGRVVRLEPGDGAVLGAISTGAGAHALAISPDGTRAWVSNQAADTVSVIDVATAAVTATIDVGVAPNAVLYRAAP